ncbi:ATPase [Mitosporidium daphniae]|uniref:ATPase n=1 Tax=Mitosporidium daphniae TaxID=1485682 RepID=A0A098VUB7_9MICR|nr:ATPase [Mitosporidium daphniae]KGG52550.1 ATPase [Mitosporidium daphniae]|eukprot:XP_013238977.1 ATPase [Mitosporidium daphniae]
MLARSSRRILVRVFFLTISLGVALLDGTAEDLEKIAQNQRKMAIKRRYEDLRRMGISEAQIAKLQANDRNFANLVNDDEEEVPMLQFGDASVAAPFTSKIGTLESVCHVLKQGRATLAATFQMYKILALNSLITAYSLSVLHNAGVRLGDFQLTISGLLLSSCFFFLSRSKPLSTLSKERPASTIFTVYSITSIIGQFAVHCFALIYLDQCIRIYSPEKPLLHSEDYTFTPSLMNSSIYLLSLLMQVSTFAINYQGPPFRESMLDNGGLKKSLFAVGSFVLVSAAEIFPDMNEMMQIVPFPPGFSAKLLFLMISDFFICFVIEVTSKRLFSKVEPKWKTTSK